MRRRAVSRLNDRISALISTSNHTPFAEIDETIAGLAPVEIQTPLIRIGSQNDGGYLLPDDLIGVDGLFSPGVSDLIDFDLSIAQRGIPCFLADGSVDAPANMFPNMSFEKKYLGARDQSDTKSLVSWVNRCAPHASDLILQMDIEGAEYDVLDACPQTEFQRFRIILIEFHDLEKLIEPHWHAKFANVLKKLNQSHTLCHVHANNWAPNFILNGREIPQVFEATYVLTERVAITGAPAKIPHRLDKPNCIDGPDLPTPKFWHSNT